MSRAGNGLSTCGYTLIVDGLAKKEFGTQDLALKAARELKGRFPMLQVKVYDAEKQAERDDRADSGLVLFHPSAPERFERLRASRCPRL